MNIEELVEKAESFNKEEIKKYKSDLEFLYNISYDAGIKLAKKYKADENIVRNALAMMDSKLPEAQHLGTQKEHISMSSSATKKLLEEATLLNDKEKENIIKCVEEHHGIEKFYSIESEVVANADCYKFIHPKGVFYYSSMLGRRLHNFSKELEHLDFKLNEKHDTLSLPLAKEELEPYYQFFQKAINEARNID